MGARLKNFELPKNIIFDENSYTPTYGKIIAEPFEKGYGVTIGNSLRRVLLSSIEGTAITHIKIDGVLHEFSTIPGVYEDLPQIIMNIKGIVLRSHFNKTARSIFISASKKGVVTAKDIQTDETIEVVNSDHPIATLTGDTKFEMELRVGGGRGYVPSERNKEENDTIGFIAVDSLFSPVTKVNIQSILFL